MMLFRVVMVLLAALAFYVGSTDTAIYVLLLGILLDMPEKSP